MSARLDIRMDAATLHEVRVRAARLHVAPSAWGRAVLRDALDARRADELDSAIGAALVGIEQRVQASADARILAAQIRPLALNVNDLDRLARSGQPVTVSADVPELIELLRDVRELLGDRLAR